jgi:hypothetical protein
MGWEMGEGGNAGGNENLLRSKKSLAKNGH